MEPVLASVAVLSLVAGPQAAPRTRPEASPLTQEINREEARHHYRAGDRLMAEEAFERAAARFRSATQLDPDYVLAYYSLGQALMKLDRYDEALSAYTEARDTLRRQSHVDQRMQVRLDQQRRDEIHELEETLQKVRSGKVKGTGGATMSMELGIEERIRMLQEAELRGAGSEVTVPAELHLALGSAYFRLGQLEPAEESYRAAIRRRGNLGAAHNNLAVICLMTGRLEEARREIRAAEEAGFFVSVRFKSDLEEREREARRPR